MPATETRWRGLHEEVGTMEAAGIWRISLESCYYDRLSV